MGWIVAESWDLHGRHRRSDPAALESSVGSGNVQTLDITDPYGGAIIETSDSLDLPTGWDQAHYRHENYDPVIVSVFAVLLVLSIISTIGLCRWRTRKLRKIRDIEDLARKEKGELDSDDERSDTSSLAERKGSIKPRKETKRQRFASARSSALRKVNDRLLSQLRRKHRLKSTTQESISIHTDNPSKNASPDPEHRTLDDNLGDTENSPRRSLNVITASTPSAEERSHSRVRSSNSRSPSRSSPRETVESNVHLEASVPTTLPPAYPSTHLPNLGSRRSEKAPLRGLEAEYDERDVDTYQRTPSSDSQDSDMQEIVPPFETSVMEGTSLVAAGATRQAHVATDDKHVLERLRSLADEPSGRALVGTSTVQEAAVPAWDELDEWEARRQIEQCLAVEGAGEVGTSITAEKDPTRPSAALLPPPPSFTTSTMLNDPSSNYTMGSVWTGLAGSSGPGEASTSRTPNEPPQLLPMLAPSAPPLLEEEGHVPSAPPLWEGEDAPEAIHASAPPLPPSTPNHSTENLHLDASQSSQVFTSVVEDRNGDSDGAESIMSHSEDNNRWSSSFRTGAREGRGLPRYEP